MQELPEDLRPGTPLVQKILGPLERAYLAQFASHDPLIGCDEYTLGTGIWRSSWYFLDEEFPGLSRRPKNTFFLEFADYNLYFYRDRLRGTMHRMMGQSGVQRAMLDVNSQICFDFVGDTPHNGKPNLVVLHTGVYPFGLTDVCIGLPVNHEDEDSAWLFMEHVHTKTPPENRSTAGDKVGHQRFSDIEAPDIDLEPRDDNEDQAGNA
jgi:hypothetical protein